MIFKEEDVVYSVPIQFWKEKEPEKCIVKAIKQTTEVQETEISQDSVYVYSEKHKYKIFIYRKLLFFSKEKCKEAIELYSKLHDLYSNDESDKSFGRTLDDKIWVNNL